MKKLYTFPDQTIHFLTDCTGEIQEMVAKLRAEIGQSFPSLIEKIYFGWKAVGYTHPQAGYVGAIFPATNQVKMGFEHGIFLPDKKQQLVFGKSAGKQLKYLIIHQLNKAVLNDVKGFIEQAIAYRLSRVSCK